MLYALTCIDKAGSGEIRQHNRPAHLTHLERHADQLVYAGPLLDAEGEKPIGSLIVIDVPDGTAAAAFAEADPYAQAGLFAEVRVCPTRQSFPKR
jgi:uncharacterized protein YciI